MIINKFKKVSANKYLVEFENYENISLYEDVILKYDLLIKKSIDDSELDVINRSNMEYDVYYFALDYLKSKMRSVYELREILCKKEFPIGMIENAIDKLILQGYLDDLYFSKCYISSQMNSTNNGPYKIKCDLIQKGIDLNIIDDSLNIFSYDEQLEHVKKIVLKKLKSNNSRGGLMLRKKIFYDLISLGYDDSIINSVLDSTSFDNDINIAKKEYDKLKRKYSRKYSGDELKRKISEMMFQKGLSYDDIFN